MGRNGVIYSHESKIEEHHLVESESKTSQVQVQQLMHELEQTLEYPDEVEPEDKSSDRVAKPKKLSKVGRPKKDAIDPMPMEPLIPEETSVLV